MITVKVLFFAADPLSADGRAQRLLLDEDVRQIREKVHVAANCGVLEFDWRLAARAPDLQQALEETHPQVVHFSGHAGSGGLVLAGSDGRSTRCVDAEVLRELFQLYPGDIRLVVLSACHSRPQAEAIAEVVGCAVGTRGRISDAAAITFNAKFYSAIACGQSVKAAFKRARMALALEHFEERDCPELLVRPDVDPAKLILVSRFRRFAHLMTAAVATLVLSSAAVFACIDPPPRGGDIGPWRAVRLGDCTSSGTAPLPAARPAAASAEFGGPSAAATLLDEAKALCRAGSYDSAVALFRRASEAGSSEALTFLGIAYVSGEGSARDPEKGMLLLHQAATRARDPRGMNALAVMYENDEAQDQRYRWARHWYEEAAKKGHPEAMRNLGRLHRTGVGVNRSDSLALEWYRKAVAAGSADAMVDIGRMREEGRAGRRDTREALRLYRAAADAGSAPGMYAMGRVYQEGVVVPRDYGQARAWYFKGACAGSAEAMNNLGLVYEQGLGVKADRGEAIRWFRRAAGAGSTVAAANLARMHADRRKGVVKALAWLDRPEPQSPPGCVSYATAGPAKVWR